MLAYDCRAELFKERGFEVLGSVVQGTQISQPDPFDVEVIHAEGRTAYQNALAQVRAGSPSKILLIRGESGCGKTHLIRAVRSETHRLGLGVFAYIHMTAEQVDYPQYLLRQVIRSLSDPYIWRPNQSQVSSALDMLSDALVQAAGIHGGAEALRDADDATLVQLVTDCADVLSEVTNPDGQPRFGGVELNTLRILLYRQSAQKAIRRRVGSFLNGDPMSPIDWQKLAAIPAECERSPLFLIGQLARVCWAAMGVPLIVCVDQIEASDITGKNHEPFIRAMSTSCELIENVPGLLVVLSCLDSAYSTHAPHLINSYRHRIENDPSPVVLAAARTADEIRQMLSRRLRWLFQGEGLSNVPGETVYPLPEDVPERLQGQKLRVVLQTVHAYCEKCRNAGEGILPEWTEGTVVSTPAAHEDEESVSVDRLRVAWNEFRTLGNNNVGEDDFSLFDLLCWAMGEVSQETEEPTTVTVEKVPTPDGQTHVPCLSVTIKPQWGDVQRRLVALCERDYRGGGLDRQLQTAQILAAKHKRHTLVVLRSTQFTKEGKAAARWDQLERAGHRRAVMEEPVWQEIQALRRFLANPPFAPEIVRQWRRADGPLIHLRGIAAIMQPAKSPGMLPMPTPPPAIPVSFENKPVHRAAPGSGASAGKARLAPDLITTVGKPAPRRAAASKSNPAREQADRMVIGQSDGPTPGDIYLDPQALSRHSCLFGASGSGKTVLAMTIVEMLLERGVSVTLFDRKGDLAGYATDDAWQQETGAPDEHRRRSALRAMLDVNLYTPGSGGGRPLVLPMLPAGLARLPEAQRQDTARESALILCDVCDPSKAKRDMFTAVLAKSIEMLCDGDDLRTLDDLQDLLLQSPPELLAALPAHVEKDCVAVGRRLSERRVAHGRLFSDHGEKLDLTEMLGPADAARARLNIISTQFLNDDSALIWVAQYLAAVGRHIVQNPSPGGRLQSLLMFDEADQYIPANRKPATKPGMDNLLRRARSAGVGVMLATQNVGDFDYTALTNIATVFAGKLPTLQSMEKLRTRFEALTDRLSKKTSGQFLMAADKQIRDIKANMCLIPPTQRSREEIETIAAQQAQVAAR